MNQSYQYALVKRSSEKDVIHAQMHQDPMTLSNMYQRYAPDIVTERSLAVQNHSQTSSIMIPPPQYQVAPTLPLGASGSSSITLEGLKSLVVINQYDCKFILAKTCPADGSPGQLVALDQHAVGERIEEERLIQSFLEEGMGIMTTKCKRPFQKVYEGKRAEAVMKFRGQLKEWGFRFSSIDDRSYNTSGSVTVTVSHSPTIFNKNMKPADLDLAIDEIAERGRPPRYPRFVTVPLKQRACHTAVKFGMKLDDSQAAQLVEDLKLCNFPFICCHGRPTIYPLAEMAHVNNLPRFNAEAIAMNGCACADPDHTYCNPYDFFNSDKFVEDELPDFCMPAVANTTTPLPIEDKSYDDTQESGKKRVYKEVVENGVVKKQKFFTQEWF